jgi:hypothetical protein
LTEFNLLTFMKTFSAKQLRQNLSEIVNDIYYNGEEVEFTYGRGEKMKRFSIVFKPNSTTKNLSKLTRFLNSYKLKSSTSKTHKLQQMPQDQFLKYLKEDYYGKDSN